MPDQAYESTQAEGHSPNMRLQHNRNGPTWPKPQVYSTALYLCRVILYKQVQNCFVNNSGLGNIAMDQFNHLKVKREQLINAECQSLGVLKQLEPLFIKVLWL